MTSRKIQKVSEAKEIGAVGLSRSLGFWSLFGAWSLGFGYCHSFLEGFADNFVPDPIEDTVNETPGFLRPIFFPEFNRLIQRHFGRDILTIKKLKDGHAEDVSIDEIHAVQAPVFRISIDHLVNFRPISLDAFSDPLGKFVAFFPRRKMLSLLDDDPGDLLFRNL